MRLFLKMVGYVEWILGTVFLTVIGTVLSLKDLNGWGQYILIITLYVFLVATTFKQFVENGWFKKWLKRSEIPND